jgi:hypothetical protein
MLNMRSTGGVVINQTTRTFVENGDWIWMWKTGDRSLLEGMKILSGETEENHENHNYNKKASPAWTLTWEFLTAI